MPVIKIKSTHEESQGLFVLIDECDFDAAKHELYIEPLPLPPAPVDLPPPPLAVVDPLDELGADWKSKDAADLKKLAEVVSGRAVENKKQAIEVIEAALAARTTK